MHHRSAIPCWLQVNGYLRGDSVFGLLPTPLAPIRDSNLSSAGSVRLPIRMVDPLLTMTNIN